jgi:hypothetical protein
MYVSPMDTALTLSVFGNLMLCFPFVLLCCVVMFSFPHVCLWSCCFLYWEFCIFKLFSSQKIVCSPVPGQSLLCLMRVQRIALSSVFKGHVFIVANVSHTKVTWTHIGRCKQIYHITHIYYVHSAYHMVNDMPYGYNRMNSKIRVIKGIIQWKHQRWMSEHEISTHNQQEYSDIIAIIYDVLMSTWAESCFSSRVRLQNAHKINGQS